MRYSISLIGKDFIYDTDYVLWKVCGAIAIHTWDMGGLSLPCRSNCCGTVLCIPTRDHHGICLGVNILLKIIKLSKIYIIQVYMYIYELVIHVYS